MADGPSRIALIGDAIVCGLYAHRYSSRRRQRGRHLMAYCGMCLCEKCFLTARSVGGRGTAIADSVLRAWVAQRLWVIIPWWLCGGDYLRPTSLQALQGKLKVENRGIESTRAIGVLKHGKEILIRFFDKIYPPLPMAPFSPDCRSSAGVAVMWSRA